MSSNTYLFTFGQDYEEWLDFDAYIPALEGEKELHLRLSFDRNNKTWLLVLREETEGIPVENVVEVALPDNMAALLLRLKGGVYTE